MKQARRPDRLKAGGKLFMEFVEHLAICDIITKRKKSAGKRISLDRLLQEEGIAL